MAFIWRIEYLVIPRVISKFTNGFLEFAERSKIEENYINYIFEKINRFDKFVGIKKGNEYL